MVTVLIQWQYVTKAQNAFLRDILYELRDQTNFKASSRENAVPSSAAMKGWKMGRGARSANSLTPPRLSFRELERTVLRGPYESRCQRRNLLQFSLSGAVDALTSYKGML